jgi:hypothetical protein
VPWRLLATSGAPPRQQLGGLLAAAGTLAACSSTSGVLLWLRIVSQTLQQLQGSGSTLPAGLWTATALAVWFSGTRLTHPQLQQQRRHPQKGLLHHLLLWQ